MGTDQVQAERLWRGVTPARAFGSPLAVGQLSPVSHLLWDFTEFGTTRWYGGQTQM